MRGQHRFSMAADRIFLRGWRKFDSPSFGSTNEAHVSSTTKSCFPMLSLLFVTCLEAGAQEPDRNGIGFVLIHPPFTETYSCSEHWEGQLQHLGDALGTDCTIWRLIKEDGRLWVREYGNSGLENQDWYGYGANVLAPCSCRVSEIRVNPVENVPGKPGKPPASWVTFERRDGTRISIVHVKEILVSEQVPDPNRGYRKRDHTAPSHLFGALLGNSNWRHRLLWFRTARIGVQNFLRLPRP